MFEPLKFDCFTFFVLEKVLSPNNPGLTSNKALLSKMTSESIENVLAYITY